VKVEPEISVAISKEVARIHGRCAGREPDLVRTVWQHDLVVCVLVGGLTDPELRLLRTGRFDRVREDRRALHDALEPPLRALVETLTGRPVLAYLAEVSPQDVAFDAFILGA
jgi:uncharacterized protein YbcI